MPKAIIGGLLGGLALWIVGFIFWGTPLAGVAYADAPEQAAAAVQLSLAQNLTPTGTGTYAIPDPSTPAGTTLFGQGPIAVVHFNTGGFPVVDTAALITVLVLALIVGVVAALALGKVARHGGGRDTALRAGLLLAIALPLYGKLSGAFASHLPLGHYAYAFIADALGFAAMVVVIAQFLPRAGAVASAELAQEERG